MSVFGDAFLPRQKRKKARRGEGQRTPLPRAFWLGMGGLLVMVAAVVGWAAVRSGTELLAAAVAIAVPSALCGVYLVYRAAAVQGDARWRWSAMGAAWAVFLASATPAANAVIPGDSLFEGYVALPGDAVTLPDEIPARVRLLVHGHLNLSPKDGDVATARFTIAGAAERVEGVLERVRVHRYSRGNRPHVFEERNLFYADAVIPPGTRALTLESVTGPVKGRLRVTGYAAAWPRWIALSLAGLGLVGIAVLDLRLGAGGNLVAVATVSLTLGALIAVSGAPGSLTHFLTGAQLGAMLLALGAGGVAGQLAKRLARSMSRRNDSRITRRGAI